MRGNGSGFYENGSFAKTTTSDLILKESAGTGSCQNNSEISKDHPPGLAAGPQAEPHSQIPNRLRGQAPNTPSDSPIPLCQGGHREGLGMLKQNSLSTASHSPAETPPLHTHTGKGTHAPQFSEGSWHCPSLPELDRAAGAVSTQPPSCLLHSQPPLFPPLESRFCQEFQGHDWWGGGHRHRGCCQVPFFPPQYVL